MAELVRATSAGGQRSGGSRSGTATVAERDEQREPVKPGAVDVAERGAQQILLPVAGRGRRCG
jgi:hypothetical protein